MVEATAAAWELELGHQKLHHPQMVALSGEYSAWLMMAVRAEHGARDDLPFSLGFFRCFAVVVEQLFCRGSSSHDKNSVYISFTARNRAKPRLTSRGRVVCRVVRPQCGAQGVELDLKVLPGKEDSSRALSKFLVVITCSMRLTFCLWLNL